VVLATHNPHKVAEFAEIVRRVRPDLEVIGYDGPEPVEDGVTFAQNALVKAGHARMLSPTMNYSLTNSPTSATPTAQQTSLRTLPSCYPTAPST
jgi:hypothetical protein